MEHCSVTAKALLNQKAAPGCQLQNHTLRITCEKTLTCDCNQSGNLGFPDSSVGKESACNAGDPGSIPGSGRATGEGLPTPVFSGFPCGSAGKGSVHNVGDLAETGSCCHSYCFQNHEVSTTVCSS